MNCKIFLVLLIPAIFFQSCGALFSGMKETIYLRSYQAGTTFYINDVEVGVDSVVKAVSKKRDLKLRASKQGCSDEEKIVKRTFNEFTLLGVFVDLGVVSILIVDWFATGAMWTFDQNYFTITPKCVKQ